MFLPSRDPRRRRPLLLGAAVAALTCLGALAQVPASATARPVAVPAVAAQAVAAPAVAAGTGAPAAATAVRASASVADLALTGTTTRVAVRRVYRSGQVQWINYVLDDRLVGVEGCQARRGATSWRGHVYRSSVYSVCPGGPSPAESAARALARSRPWYRITVEHVPLVAFSLLADLPSGNDRAVPAAIAHLPAGAGVFFEGDDVSLTYAAPGVTQAQLDAAVAAFARALGVPASRISVSPLAAG